MHLRLVPQPDPGAPLERTPAADGRAAPARWAGAARRSEAPTPVALGKARLAWRHRLFIVALGAATTAQLAAAIACLVGLGR